MAEWLRRSPAKAVGDSLAGSIPAVVVFRLGFIQQKFL